MFRILLISSLVLSFAVFASAQDEPAEKGKLKAETQFTVKSLAAIDAEASSVGQDINFVLISPVEGEGLKLEPGAELLGRIVNIKKVNDDNETSQISILFDFVQSGDEFMPCKAVIIAIENAPAGIKLKTSETIEGGTLLMMEGKNLKVAEGSIFKVKLVTDIETG